MGRHENPNWKREAFEYFFNGKLHRYYFEKLVDLGLMDRRSIQKDIVGRGRNPVEYYLTDKGWTACGKEKQDLTVNTKNSEEKVEKKEKRPLLVVNKIKEKEVKITPKAVEPAVNIEIPKVKEEPKKPSIIDSIKSERSIYFENANWNTDWKPDPKDDDGLDMPVFLNRKHPVWQEWFRIEKEMKAA